MWTWIRRIDVLTFAAGFGACLALLVSIAIYRIRRRERGSGSVTENLQMSETVVAFTESPEGDRTYAATK